MSTDITPTDSACPIFLVPVDETQLAIDQAADKAADKIAKDKIKQRAALLDRLGITSDEASLLLG
jgi:hypothetical protein